MKFVLLLLGALIIGGVGGYFLSRSKSSDFNLSASASPAASPETTAENETPVDSSFLTVPEVVKAVIATAQGNIELDLYPSVAPKTVFNFVKLANEKFYDGTTFHRVISDFMIQGGDPLSRALKSGDPKIGSGGPGYKFEDEINPRALGVPEETIKQYEAAGYQYNYSLKSLPVDPGYIAMANAGPSTNGSQFFIVTTKPQPHLYGKHTVFGKVTKGMEGVLKVKQGDVIQSIQANTRLETPPTNPGPQP